MTLLTTKESAAHLGIGVRTFQERVAAQEICKIKIGKSVRFHPDDLAAFVERSRVKSIGWKSPVKALGGAHHG